MRPDWNHIIRDDWSLMLDRDGVINRRIVDGYVTSWDAFEWLPGVLDALEIFSQRFRHILIVTNQQGVGKGLMSMEQLEAIHDKMCAAIEAHRGRIDGILVCPQLASEPGNYRKPNPDMAWMAREIYPDLDLSHCVMIGDGLSDMEFGRRAGTKTIFIGEENPGADDYFSSILEFANLLKQ